MKAALSALPFPAVTSAWVDGDKLLRQENGNKVGLH